jgi:SHS2 domain-containing protein
VGYRWIEHTAELELHIDAPSESGVFQLAVAAVGELAAGDGDGDGGGAGEANASITREVAVTAPDRAALLAAFLEELVYLLETEDLVPQSAEHVRLLDGSVTATVGGRRGDPRHIIKGVTYHKLSFVQGERGFSATVVLDV